MHFSSSFRRDKSRVGSVEHVVVCSRAVSSRSPLLIPSAVIAVARARRRPSVGGGSRRAVVTGPVRTGVCAGAPRTAGIGNAGVNGNGPGRQLTPRRRARVSAQRRTRRFLPRGCVIGRAAMSGSRCGTSIRAGVSAASGVAWRCGGCSTGRPGIGSGDGAGGANDGPGVLGLPTRREHVFVDGMAVHDHVKCRRPQRRKERAGTKFASSPRFLSSECWGLRGGYVHGLG
jgi:hypothetical protein